MFTVCIVCVIIPIDGLNLSLYFCLIINKTVTVNSVSLRKIIIFGGDTNLKRLQYYNNIHMLSLHAEHYCTCISFTVYMYMSCTVCTCSYCDSLDWWCSSDRYTCVHSCISLSPQVWRTYTGELVSQLSNTVCCRPPCVFFNDSVRVASVMGNGQVMVRE